jgi:exonuclease III
LHQKPLKIGYLNIHGLVVEGINKLDAKQIRNSIDEHDIFCFAETWVKEKEREFKIKNHTVLNFVAHKGIGTQQGRSSGGFLLVYKNSLKDCVEVLHQSEIKSHRFTIWIKIKLQEKDLFVGFIYLPPVGSSLYSKTSIDKVYQDIEEDICRLSELGVISITGDWNARTGKQTDFSIGEFHQPQAALLNNILVEQEDVLPIRISEDELKGGHNEFMLQICEAFNLCILNGRFGIASGAFTSFNFMKGKSVVDYALLDRAAFPNCQNFQVLESYEYSDHQLISWSLKCHELDRNPQVTNENGLDVAK